MIEMYCDACGVRVYGQRYIKAKVDVGNAKGVEIHAYAPSSHDLCRSCLRRAVVVAEEETDGLSD